MSCLVLLCLGVGMWVPSFILLDEVWTLVTTLLLVITNAILMMRVFYKTKATPFLSSFVPFAYWALCSALPLLHYCWQGQVAVLGAQLTYIILLGIDFQHQPLSESFLSTLVLCCTALFVPEIVFVIPLVWIYIIYRRVMTLRVILASLIAIATFAMYYTIAVLLGWIDLGAMNMFSLSHLPMWLAVAQMIVCSLIIYLPVRFPSVWWGALFVFSCLAAIATCTTCHLLMATTPSIFPAYFLNSIPPLS